MPDTNALDFYDLDELLTEEERMTRDTVRAWVKNRFMPTVRESWHKGTFPTQLVPELGELGIFGASIKGYGCPGMSEVAYGLIMQEIERGDSGLRSFASVQSGLSMTAINKFGSEEQKQKFLPEMRKAKLLFCFGLTEPDFGSNPGGMKTSARTDGDSYVLNGAKMWITNGTIAKYAIVWAKLDGNDSKDIRGFIVPTDSKGFKAPEMHGKLSMRVSITSELVLEDVRIPKSNLLPKSNGLGSPLSCLNHARYGIAWGAIGSAQACYLEALDYAKSRVQFSRPIAGYQLVQNKFAHMVTEITKAQLVAWRLGRLFDAGRQTPQMISLAKRNNVAIALDIARMARDMLGANGITDEYCVMRHMCNLETVKTYEGTHDMHTLILGQAATGMAAFDG